MLRHRFICGISRLFLEKKASFAICAFLLFALIFAAASFANLNEDIYIDSDILTVNRQENSATFEGEVILRFEGMVLKTSNLKVVYKEDPKKASIDRIIIPAKVKAAKTEGTEIIIADSAEYKIDKAELILLGNVVLQKKDHILKTEKLVYHGNLKSIKKE